MHERPWPTPSSYVTSVTFIILAPAFVMASLYQLLAHVILANGRGSSSLVTKAALGCGFAVLDIVGYAVQAAGE
jgi:RTA1 like protein